MRILIGTVSGSVSVAFVLGTTTDLWGVYIVHSSIVGRVTVVRVASRAGVCMAYCVEPCVSDTTVVKVVVQHGATGCGAGVWNGAE